MAPKKTGAAAKGKQASGDDTVTSGQSTKHTKTTATTDATDGNSEITAGSVVKLDEVGTLALSDRFWKTREKKAREKKDLEECEQENQKLKDELAEAHEQLKRQAHKAKHQIAASRDEFLAAAVDLVGAPSTKDPEVSLEDAESILQNLKAQDPERYSALIRAQPDYVDLTAEPDHTDPAEKQSRENENGSVSNKGKSPAIPDAIVSNRAARAAFDNLEAKLLNGIDEMRSNSNVTSLKKTLRSKTATALQTAKQTLLAPRESGPGGARFNGRQGLTPTAENAALNRKNQQFLRQIIELEIKLKSIRQKLGEEVTMRKAAQAVVRANINVITLADHEEAAMPKEVEAELQPKLSENAPEDIGEVNMHWDNMQWEVDSQMGDEMDENAPAGNGEVDLQEEVDAEVQEVVGAELQEEVDAEVQDKSDENAPANDGDVAMQEAIEAEEQGQ